MTGRLLPLLLPIALLATGATRPPPRTPAAAYVQARAADARGDLGRAADGYAAALAAAPGDRLLGQRLYRQALAAGDVAAALRAARTLDVAGALPPDGRHLLIAEAVRTAQWAVARAELAKLPSGDLFAFLSPVVAAWIALGERRDPLAELVPGRGGAVGLPYLAEHRALLLLATDRRDEGLAAIQALGLGTSGRAARLKLIAAATLDPRRERDAALALLAGSDPLLVRARASVAAGQALAGGVETPAEGLAELYARVAMDLNRERVTPLALGFARFATMLAPANGQGWLLVSGMLAANGFGEAGLAALDRVPAGDPLAPAARDQRLRLLVRAGRTEAALAEARAGTLLAGATSADWSRVGDLEGELGRADAAAAAYAKAIAVAGDDPTAGEGLWSLWLQHGAALEQAGRWPQARAALEKAVALAPDQPSALNHLGYGLLEHGEALPQATRLIERASALAPDDMAITDSLGWAYFRQGRLPQAIRALESAAAGEPGDSAINEHLGDAYWTVGRRVEARYAWRAALVYAEPAEASRIAAKIDFGPAQRP